MTRSRCILAVLLLLVVASGPVQSASGQAVGIDWSAGGMAASDTALVEPKRFGRAAIEVFGINALVWSYNRFIREGGENPVFRIGFDSWAENLSAGYNWDDNSFAGNQFAHPYHGNLYYNAARSNGYNFWESAPFAFAGSFMWEYFGETHHPAMNDWVGTSLGGIALGEITHRLATTVRDNQATGAARNVREVGGMLIDPIGGLNRIIDGDWGRRGLNPRDRFPDNYRSRLDVGLRTRGEERLWEADTTDVYVALEFDYGDPFFGDLGKPFANFEFALELYFGDKTSIADVAGSGNLAGVFLKETREASHILGAFQHYDYVNTNALEFGGQSITGGLLSRFETASGLELRTRLELGPMILGGCSSDYESVSGRSYDYGPGPTARFSASFGRNGWEFLEVSHHQFWIHSISGNRVDHHVSRTRARLSLPVVFNVGLGLEYRLDLSESDYKDYADVTKRNPQGRVYLRWILN
jgi:hypothetical protein